MVEKSTTLCSGPVTSSVTVSDDQTCVRCRSRLSSSRSKSTDVSIQIEGHHPSSRRELTEGAGAGTDDEMSSRDKTYCLACQGAVKTLILIDEQPELCATNVNTEAVKKVKSRFVWLIVGIVISALVFVGLYVTFCCAATVPSVVSATGGSLERDDSDSALGPRDVLTDTDTSFIPTYEDYHHIRAKRDLQIRSNDRHDELYPNSEEVVDKSEVNDDIGIADILQDDIFTKYRAKHPSDSDQEGEATNANFLFPKVDKGKSVTQETRGDNAQPKDKAVLLKWLESVYEYLTSKEQVENSVLTDEDKSQYVERPAQQIARSGHLSRVRQVMDDYERALMNDEKAYIAFSPDVEEKDNVDRKANSVHSDVNDNDHMKVERSNDVDMMEADASITDLVLEEPEPEDDPESVDYMAGEPYNYDDLISRPGEVEPQMTEKTVTDSNPLVTLEDIISNRLSRPKRELYSSPTNAMKPRHSRHLMSKSPREAGPGLHAKFTFSVKKPNSYDTLLRRIENGADENILGVSAKTQTDSSQRVDLIQTEIAPTPNSTTIDATDVNKLETNQSTNIPEFILIDVSPQHVTEATSTAVTTAVESDLVAEFKNAPVLPQNYESLMARLRKVNLHMTEKTVTESNPLRQLEESILEKLNRPKRFGFESINREFSKHDQAEEQQLPGRRMKNEQSAAIVTSKHSEKSPLSGQVIDKLTRMTQEHERQLNTSKIIQAHVHHTFKPAMEVDQHSESISGDLPEKVKRDLVDTITLNISIVSTVATPPEMSPELYAEYGDHLMNNSGEELVWTVQNKGEDLEQLNSHDKLLLQLEQEVNSTNTLPKIPSLPEVTDVKNYNTLIPIKPYGGNSTDLLALPIAPECSNITDQFQVEDGRMCMNGITSKQSSLHQLSSTKFSDYYDEPLLSETNTQIIKEIPEIDRLIGESPQMPRLIVEQINVDPLDINLKDPAIDTLIHQGQTVDKAVEDELCVIDEKPDDELMKTKSRDGKLILKAGVPNYDLDIPTNSRIGLLDDETRANRTARALHHALKKARCKLFHKVEPIPKAHKLDSDDTSISEDMVNLAEKVLVRASETNTYHQLSDLEKIPYEHCKLVRVHSMPTSENQTANASTCAQGAQHDTQIVKLYYPDCEIKSTHAEDQTEIKNKDMNEPQNGDVAVDTSSPIEPRTWASAAEFSRDHIVTTETVVGVIQQSPKKPKIYDNTENTDYGDLVSRMPHPKLLPYGKPRYQTKDVVAAKTSSPIEPRTWASAAELSRDHIVTTETVVGVIQQSLKKPKIYDYTENTDYGDPILRIPHPKLLPYGKPRYKTKDVVAVDTSSPIEPRTWASAAEFDRDHIVTTETVVGVIQPSPKKPNIYDNTKDTDYGDLVSRMSYLKLLPDGELRDQTKDVDGGYQVTTPSPIRFQKIHHANNDSGRLARLKWVTKAALQDQTQMIVPKEEIKIITPDGGWVFKEWVYENTSECNLKHAKGSLARIHGIANENESNETEATLQKPLDPQMFRPQVEVQVHDVVDGKLLVKREKNGDISGATKITSGKEECKLHRHGHTNCLGPCLKSTAQNFTSQHHRKFTVSDTPAFDGKSSQNLNKHHAKLTDDEKAICGPNMSLEGEDENELFLDQAEKQVKIKTQQGWNHHGQVHASNPQAPTKSCQSAHKQPSSSKDSISKVSKGLRQILSDSQSSRAKLEHNPHEIKVVGQTRRSQGQLLEDEKLAYKQHLANDRYPLSLARLKHSKFYKSLRGQEGKKAAAKLTNGQEDSAIYKVVKSTKANVVTPLNTCCDAVGMSSLDNCVVKHMSRQSNLMENFVKENPGNVGRKSNPLFSTERSYRDTKGDRGIDENAENID